MKRLHLHINTPAEALDDAIGFYTTLFDHAPTKRRDGYAQWKLSDPSVNFVVESICHAGDRPGVHHVGIETDDAAVLSDIRARFARTDAPQLDVGQTTCCFARSDKLWARDPDGLRWEMFQSFGDVDRYGAQTEAELAHYTAALDPD